MTPEEEKQRERVIVRAVWKVILQCLGILAVILAIWFFVSNAREEERKREELEDLLRQKPGEIRY